MNLLAPVSTIMTSKLLTLGPEDPLTKAKELFEEHNIHHLPVVRFKELMGIVSKTDLLFLLKGMAQDNYDKFLNQKRLERFQVKDIMTTGIAKLEHDDRINVALEVFKVNLFHALPVMKDGDLVGILTTYDIIKALADEPTQVSGKA